MRALTVRKHMATGTALIIGEKKPPLSVAVFSLSVIAHAVSFYIYLPLLSTEFIVLLMLSLLLSVMIFLTDNRMIFLVVAAVRFVLILFLGHQTEYHDISELLLMAVLFLEIGISEHFPLNLYMSLGLLLVSIYLRYPIPKWGRALSQRTLLNLMSYSFVLFVIAIFSSLLTYYRERLIRRQKEITRLETAVTKLTTANTGFQDCASAVEERITMSERNRISRDIHDTVGYTMTNLIMTMEAATDLAFTEPNKVRELLELARDQADLGLKDLRQSLYELRAKDLQDVSGVRAIQRLTKIYHLVTGVKVHIEYGNLPWSCGREIDSALYHMVQEGLTNAFRHGMATEIRVLFWVDKEGIRLSMRDNGIGSVGIKEGIGISGMKERLNKLGGRIHIQSGPNGFEILAYIPMVEGNEED